MKSGHDTCMGYPNRYSSCIPHWWKICCKNSGDPGRTIAVEKNGMKTFFPLPRDRFLPYKNGGRRRWQNKQEGSENCNANTSLVHVKYVYILQNALQIPSIQCFLQEVYNCIEGVAKLTKRLQNPL